MLILALLARLCFIARFALSPIPKGLNILDILNDVPLMLNDRVSSSSWSVYVNFFRLFGGGGLLFVLRTGLLALSSVLLEKFFIDVKFVGIFERRQKLCGRGLSDII